MVCRGDHVALAEAGPGQRREGGARDEGDRVDHEVDRWRDRVAVDAGERYEQCRCGADGHCQDQQAVEPRTRQRRGESPRRSRDSASAVTLVPIITSRAHALRRPGPDAQSCGYVQSPAPYHVCQGPSGARVMGRVTTDPDPPSTATNLGCRADLRSLDRRHPPEHPTSSEAAVDEPDAGDDERGPEHDPRVDRLLEDEEAEGDADDRDDVGDERRPRRAPVREQPEDRAGRPARSRGSRATGSRRSPRRPAGPSTGARTGARSSPVMIAAKVTWKTAGIIGARPRTLRRE